ncbi:MAG: hypothetical protein ACTJLM_02915 [Ehrlichia sp.]
MPIKKLCILRQFQDGFYIAEQDLLLRGSGDVLGVKQSGLSNFKFADVYKDQSFIYVAGVQAEKVLNEENSGLSEALIELLRIFGYDSSVINY